MTLYMTLSTILRLSLNFSVGHISLFVGFSVFYIFVCFFSISKIIFIFFLADVKTINLSNVFFLEPKFSFPFLNPKPSFSFIRHKNPTTSCFFNFRAPLLRTNRSRHKTLSRTRALQSCQCMVAFFFFEKKK